LKNCQHNKKTSASYAVECKTTDIAINISAYSAVINHSNIKGRYYDTI